MIGVCTTALFFNMNVSVKAQGNPQGLWSGIGPDTVTTNRFANVNNTFRANNAHILINAQIDSILRAMQAIVDNTLSVGSDITIGGNGSIDGWFNIAQWLNVEGQTQTGSLLVNQSSILGIADAFKLTADSIIAQYLTATNIFAGTIDAGQYLLNGLSLVSSQWVSSGSNIYYTGGNAGIGTDDPQKALHVLTVHDIPFSLPPPVPVPVPSPVGGSHHGIRLEDQTTRHPTKIDQVTNITIWDLEPRGGNLVIGTPGNAKMTLSETGVGIGKEPQVALDVAGSLKVSEDMTANNLKVSGAVFDSLHVDEVLNVSKKLKIGSSTLILESATGGLLNNIYSTDGDLKIQSTGTDLNTIIGLSNPSFTGIGTLNPQKKLHVKTTHTSGFQEPKGGSHQGLRLEDVFVQNNITSLSVWDLEPDGKTGKLHIGKPEDPVITFTNQGNVGIGTTNPVKKLHVKTNHFTEFLTEGDPIPPPPCPVLPCLETGTHFGLRLEDEFTLKHGFTVVGSGDTTFNITNNSSIWDIEPIGETRNLHFSNPSKTVMTLTDTGSVGIGITQPGAKLDVSGSINATDYLKNGQPFAGEWQTSGNDISNANIGNVGIGTTSPPQAKLHIIGCPGCDFSQSQPALFKVHQSDNTAWAAEIYNNGGNGKGLLIISDGTTSGVPALKTQNVGGDIGLVVNSDGKVNIGRTITGGDHQDYKLAVDGKIVARSYKATINNWGDYVLKHDYRLMTPKKVKEHIEKYGYLPGTPSAKDILTNGLDLGEMSLLHHVKLEENTLYIINHDERIEELEKENKELKKEMAVLKKEVEELKKKK